MSKNGYRNKSKSKYTYQTNNTNNSNSETQFNNLEDDLDFFSPISNQERPGRIIQQSTEHSYDDMGNRVVTTKTVREIDTMDNKNKNFNNSKKSYVSKTSQGSKQDKPRRPSKYLNAKNEAEKQRALYSSPDFQSGSPYDSPIYMNDYDDGEYQSNYRYETREIKGKNVGKYERYEYKNKNQNRQLYGNSREESPDIEIISPVGYIANYSSGSEYEDNQMKSFDNYQTSGIRITGNKYNFNAIPRNRNINYELEDPEGFDYLRNNDRTGKNKFAKDFKNTQFLNRSEYRRKIDDSYQSGRDFQSPERNINEEKRFRKVTVGMIDSKGPTNNDRKVTKIMTSKEINPQGNKINEHSIKKTKVYKNKLPKNKNNLSKIEAAKIIQSWWRRRIIGEEEVYDITVRKAIKLQSFIRGFLVRKKVLRYITLAIYYQSFCDKLQDVLCNNIKKDVFYFLKNKFLHNTSIPRKIPNRPINDNRNPKNIPTRPINDKTYPSNIQNNRNITKTEMVITKTKRTKQQNIPQKRNYHIIRTNQYPNNYPTSVNYRSPTSYLSPMTYTNTYTQVRSPEVSHTRQTDVKIYHISPDIYNRNRIYKYSQNLNKSFDNVIYDRKNTKFTTENRYNYTRVDNDEEKERNISPTFGVLSKNITNKRRVLTTTNSIGNINNRKNIYKSNSNKNIINTTTTTKTTKKIITSAKSAKKPVKITTKKRKVIEKNKISRIPTGKNEIISGGTLSIVKLPNRNLNYSESEDIYTKIKEKRIEKYEREKRESRFKQLNAIDNQLSINIVRIPKKEELVTKKDKKEREEYIRYIEKPVEIIKEKEKIVIQKEPKPETAEEGNDTQVFDMKVIQGVAMSIEASAETKEIIKEELKEIEIFKKREKEKNKQIKKYKKDIEQQKKKNKLDKLKNIIRIAEYWRQKNLRKKFKQYKNNCSPEPVVVEKKIIPNSMEITNQIQIRNEKPKLIDMEVQHEPEDNYIDNKKLIIEIKGTKPEVSESVTQCDKLESKIYKINPFTIKGEPKKEIVEKVETIEKKIIPNTMEITNQIQIRNEKPKLIDMEVQHEPEDNYIDNKKLIVEIKGIKPEVSESVTQCDKLESKIYKINPFTIKGEPKKEIIQKVETAEAECNTFNETVEQGVNAVVVEEPKPKNIEVQIRTVKRSLVKMEIPLLKRLWLRKAFRTFRDNCKRPEYHKVLGREILRMALLKWRFIKGYGPDRYGNAYDRDGNLLYKTKAKVVDSEVQQEFKVEQEDEATQYIPIENIISTLKQIEIGAAYKRKKMPEKVDQSVGDDIKLSEAIQRGATITYKYKKKEKPENKIAKNQRLEIKKVKKELIDQGTEMQKFENKISRLEKLNISGVENRLRNKLDLRKKELLIQMIYRKMMGDKLALSDSLRQWLKQTLLMLQIDQFNLYKEKKRYTNISKSDRFALIEEIKKMEMGTQMEKSQNKIEAISNINLIRTKKMEDSETSTNFVSQFDIEKIKLQKESKLTYKSNKKPIILETQKENEMNILGQNYIFEEEIKKGIHHPMTEERKRRVNEILIKYFQTKGDPISLLRKYFSIWNRKATYLGCLDNAKIITEFCRTNLNRTKNYRRWKKICEKLILKEKMKIIKLSRVEDFKKNKIFDLIRITRINQVLAKKRYLHYIILCWLAYMRNMKRKREHIKVLYENMLNTYMHMADDVFGNNQKENPSVQDALFEAVESDKFQTRDLHDVPLAEKYYQEKKEIKKVTTNLAYVNDNNPDTEQKEYITYKAFVTKHPLTTSSSSGNIKKKVITEKVIKVSPGERLQSKGRGRKYRTKVEREILNKFYDDKKLYSKKKRNEKEEEKEKEEENEINIRRENYGNDNYGENKSISIKITSNKMDNNLGSSYNYSMNINNNNLNKSGKKKEMSYRKRRAMLRFKKEEEKEIEEDEK